MKTNRTKSNEGTIVNSNPHFTHTPTLSHPLPQERFPHGIKNYAMAL